MNERITDLLPNPFAVDYQYKDGPLDLYTEKEMIRFAEKIVRECIQVVDDTMTENQEMNIGLVMASAKIIAHFGVEE